MTVRDLRMDAEAVEKRWPIPPEVRKLVIQRAVKTLADPNSSDRAVANASRVIMYCEKQNQEDELSKKPTRDGTESVVVYLPENGRD